MDNSKLISTLNLIFDNVRETKESLRLLSGESASINLNVWGAHRHTDNIISMLESLINELKQENK